ncbi:MAG: RNA polymerase sigma factor RpoD/SigA [Candidatus Omnitrophica bacterium]|nr:RNA polymerase sigma factor RpoD/SigA [Candidatus Omnitrophota bacterium]
MGQSKRRKNKKSTKSRRQTASGKRRGRAPRSKKKPQKKTLAEVLSLIRSRQEKKRVEREAARQRVRKTRATSKEKEALKTAEQSLRQEARDILRNEAVLEAPDERRRRRREPDDESQTQGGTSQDQTLDRTPMKIYLDQIENIPLLTPEEEVVLSERVRDKSRGAIQARSQMIRSNLRLVISIAKRYANMGLSFSDLVEEGNIGLMRAVTKFNPDRGYRFSTYASWWIKQAIMRSLSNQGKTIRIPVYMYDVIAKWRKVRDGLTQKLNRPPTRKEIANVMQISIHKVKEIENIAGKPSSLNAPVSLDGTAELIDLIEDDSSHMPDAYMAEIFKDERIQRLLDTLDERERKILVLRFGLGKEEEHTLEEVAQQFGITRERVRQIEASALKKIRLRLSEENDRLENYLTS